MSMPQLRITKQITRRDNHSIEKYLHMVQAIKLLTVDEEISLTKTIKKGFASQDKVKEAKEALKAIQKKIRATNLEAKKALDAEKLPNAEEKKGEKEVAQKLDAEKIPDAEELLKAKKALESAKKKSEKALLEAGQAREKLVNGNLRFVISVAKQYQNRGLSISDLINEGNIGLIKAAERFDETRGFKFISYAVWWIRQSILQATQETARMIRIPLNKMSVIQKIYKEAKRLKKILERNPTESEIGEELGMSAREVSAILEMNMKPLSINAPFNEGEENTLLDILEDEQAVHPEANLLDESMRESLIRAINTLDPREQKVIKEHFCIGEKILGKEQKEAKKKLLAEKEAHTEKVLDAERGLATLRKEARIILDAEKKAHAEKVLDAERGLAILQQEAEQILDAEQKTLKAEQGKVFSKTLEDIAKEMKLTRERVRQIREQGIKKIREFFAKKESKNSYRSMKNRFSKSSPYLIK